MMDERFVQGTISPKPALTTIAKSFGQPHDPARIVRAFGHAFSDSCGMVHARYSLIAVAYSIAVAPKPPLIPERTFKAHLGCTSSFCCERARCSPEQSLLKPHSTAFPGKGEAGSSLSSSPPSRTLLQKGRSLRAFVVA